MHLHTSQQVAIFRDRNTDDLDGWPSAPNGEAEVSFFRVDRAPTRLVQWALISGIAEPQEGPVDANTPIYALTIREHGEPPHGSAALWRCSLHCHCRAETRHGRAQFLAWTWDEALGRVAALFTEGAYTIQETPNA